MWPIGGPNIVINRKYIVRVSDPCKNRMPDTVFFTIILYPDTDIDIRPDTG